MQNKYKTEKGQEVVIIYPKQNYSSTDDNSFRYFLTFKNNTKLILSVCVQKADKTVNVLRE